MRWANTGYVRGQSRKNQRGRFQNSCQSTPIEYCTLLILLRAHPLPRGLNLQTRGNGYRRSAPEVKLLMPYWEVRPVMFTSYWKMTFVNPRWHYVSIYLGGLWRIPHRKNSNGSYNKCCCSASLGNGRCSWKSQPIPFV